MDKSLQCEIAGVEIEQEVAEGQPVRELNDLALALVGGGIGDVVWN